MTCVLGVSGSNGRLGPLGAVPYASAMGYFTP